MNIQIINGPNLNLLGVREKSIYGDSSFDDYLSDLRKRFANITINYYQSNVEGEIINKLHEVGFSSDGIVMKRMWAGEIRNVFLLVANAVNSEGFREILGICEGAKEDKAGWASFLESWPIAASRVFS